MYDWWVVMIICAGVDIVRSREFHCESVGVSRLKF